MASSSVALLILGLLGVCHGKAVEVKKTWQNQMLLYAAASHRTNARKRAC